MARIIDHLFGKIKGKLGNLILSSWKGISYLRIRTAKFHDRKSVAQKKCRSRFSACSKMGSILKTSLLMPIWNPVAEKMTGYNLFVRTNMKNFDDKGMICNYPGFIFSFGDLPGLRSPELKTIPGEEDRLEITWIDNSEEVSASPDDQLMIVKIIGQEVSFMNKLPFTRSNRKAIFRYSYGKDGFFHCYPLFSNADFTQFSPNNYISISLNESV